MRFSLAALVIVTSALLSAQQQQPPPVFRAGTDLVEVDVVVHGRNGEFVSDLTADDFTIEEAGRPQTIEQFYVHVADGVSKPGDHVALRAEMDVLVALSNCPQINNPANGYNPTPIRLTIATGEAA